MIIMKASVVEQTTFSDMKVGDVAMILENATTSPEFIGQLVLRMVDDEFVLLSGTDSWGGDNSMPVRILAKGTTLSIE